MKRYISVIRAGCIVTATVTMLLGLVVGPAYATAETTSAGYKLERAVSLGAPERWDYLHYDPQSGRVYIAHGDEVTVANGRSGKIMGNVTGMPGGTHGIAISHATGQGFTDDGKAGEAVVFDLKTLKVTHRIKAEPDADGIIYDESSRHVFVIDGDSGDLTVIDPNTDRAVATVHVGAKLEFGVSGDNGKLYVDGVEKHNIVRIDTKTNKVDAAWPMPTCEKPHGLAIDRAHHRLFATCANAEMVVVNADNGAIVTILPIQKGSDAARFDPKSQIAFSSNFSGTLSVIHEDSPDHYTVYNPVKTPLSARTMGLNVKTGRIYLIAADMTVDPKAPPTDYRHRYHIAPNSVKLYILDPMQ